MKRILAILCSFILLCSFAGCKGVMGGEDGASVSLTDSFSEGDSKGSSGAAVISESADSGSGGSSLAERRRYVEQYRERIIVYGWLIAAVKDDGTLLYTEKGLKEKGFLGQEDRIDALRDVAGLKPAFGFSGVKKDGSVFALWNNSSKKNIFPHFETWTDITDWNLQMSSVLAVKEDGTVIMDGELREMSLANWPEDWIEYDLTGWQDITAVTCAYLGSDMFGLKRDGTVCYVSTSKRSVEEKAFENVLKWKDIVQLSSSQSHIAGLRSDGGVEVTGSGIDTYNSYLNNAAYWKDIVSIAVGNNGIAGLKADGTVVYAGDDTKGQEACLEWEDIIAIAMGDEYVVGLREDGAVVSTSAGNLTAGWNIFENRG